MKRIILFIGCLCFLCSITAQDRLLENSITPQQLQEVLQPTEKWVTYPAYTDRSAWTTRIPAEIRENIIKAGEKHWRMSGSQIWQPTIWHTNAVARY